MAVVSLGILLVLAIPMFSIRLGVADQGNDPTSQTTRRAYDLLADGFGAGFQRADPARLRPQRVDDRRHGQPVRSRPFVADPDVAVRRAAYRSTKRATPPWSR